MTRVDEYLSRHNLWGSPVHKSSEPFDFGRFFASLIQTAKLKMSEVCELTLPEALLYTLDLESKPLAMSLRDAIAKARMLGRLPLDHYLALARLRTC